MVSFLLKTAIMQDSGCPYTSMKSGYEIVKKYHGRFLYEKIKSAEIFLVLKFKCHIFDSWHNLLMISSKFLSLTNKSV